MVDAPIVASITKSALFFVSLHLLLALFFGIGAEYIGHACIGAGLIPKSAILAAVSYIGVQMGEFS